MAVTQRLTSAQYSIAFSENFSSAGSDYSSDSSKKLIFHTAEPGYTLCGRHLLPSPVGSGYLDSVAYNASSDELVVVAKATVPSQDDVTYYLEDFELKMIEFNYYGITRAGITAAHQFLKGYDRDDATGQLVPRQLGDITEFFQLITEFNQRAKVDKGMSLWETPFNAHVKAEILDDGQDDFMIDEDAVEDFAASEIGRDLFGYLKAIRQDSTMPLAFYKRMISMGHLPHPAPVGTIVEGHYRKFGLPVPPNLVEYQSRSFNNMSAINPHLAGGGLSNADYSVTRSGSVSSGGTVSGSNSLFIGKNNLPTNSFGFDLEVTPRGSVSVNSYSGSKTTSSDTHRHKLDGDSAAGIQGGSYGGDRVLNNDDGSLDLDVYTENDTHNHTVNISHGHSASFSGTTETHSGNIQLNTSQSQIDVRSKSLTVERYFVAW